MLRNSGRLRSRRYRGGFSGRAATELHRRGVASAELATRLRRELVLWVQDYGVSAEIACVVGLASYEATSNSAMHAYPSGTLGVLELDAVVSPRSVSVTVADRGRWRLVHSADGLGLALIRRLAEYAEIVRGEHRTVVLMTWSLHPTSRR